MCACLHVYLLYLFLLGFALLFFVRLFVCFLKKDLMELEGWGGMKDMGGDEGRETDQNILYENTYFHKSEKHTAYKKRNRKVIVELV